MLIFVWTGFVVLILGLLALDLGVLHRTSRVIGVREALGWTAAWIAVAALFGVVVYGLYGENWLGWSDLHEHRLTGRAATIQYFTGYLLEKSLSVDNIFVIALIFAYFQVPAAHQHRVLFWGILGAIVLRGVMIGVGAALLHRFEWVTYVFGGILLLTALRLLLSRETRVDPERNLLVRAARRLVPVSNDFEGSRFFTTVDGRRALTPLFLALLLVESTDVIFAVDSIPAIFAVTRDPFIVFTSNVFAILGLRSLYFALAGLMDRFRYLKLSLVLVLAFVAAKMLLSHHYDISNIISLAAVAGILGAGVAASLLAGSRESMSRGRNVETSK